MTVNSLIAAMLVAASIASAQSIQKWRTPGGKIYYGANPPPDSEMVSVDAEGAASRPSSAEAISEGLHETAIELVRDAGRALQQCKVSERVAVFTAAERQEVLNCLGPIGRQPEQQFRELERRLEGKSAALAVVRSFMTAWRVAMAQSPPEIDETARDYGVRQAAIRGDVDRAAAQVQAQPF